MALGEQFEPALAAARAGADWALSSLYLELHPLLIRYLRAQQPQDADDLAQDTWIDVASGLSRFSGGERDFRKWVFTIARRRLVDLRRKAARRRTQPVPIESLEHVASELDVEGQAVDTLTAQAAISRIVEILPADQAEVVLLRVVAGLTSEEAGEVMNKRPGAIRVLQHRALDRLAREFSPAAVTGGPSNAM